MEYVRAPKLHFVYPFANLRPCRRLRPCCCGGRAGCRSHNREGGGDGCRRRKSGCLRRPVCDLHMAGHPTHPAAPRKSRSWFGGMGTPIHYSFRIRVPSPDIHKPWLCEQHPLQCQSDDRRTLWHLCGASVLLVTLCPLLLHTCPLCFPRGFAPYRPETSHKGSKTQDLTHPR